MENPPFSNFATNIRSITDGETNTGYTDLDGLWTDGAPAYIFNPANRNVNTNCKLVMPGDENANVGTPGIKVCPITTAYASMGLRTRNQGLSEVDPVNGRQFFIETHPLVGQEPTVDELNPTRLLGASKGLDGPLHQNLEAFKVGYHFFIPIFLFNK